MAFNNDDKNSGSTLTRGALRKKRMRRQRRSNFELLLLPFATSSTSSSSASNSSSASSSSLVIEPNKFKFILQKELKKSDVGPNGRIVLPKRACEEFLPSLDAKEGVLIDMVDMEDARVWYFKYRFWPNNRSRMYLLENTGEFVRTHDLQVGDFLMLYKDEYRQKYVVRARKALDLNVYCDREMSPENSVPSVSDSEVKDSNHINVSYPPIGDMELFSFDDNTFPDLNLPDFIPMDIQNFSSLGTMTSFGSFDNGLLDYF